MKLRKAVTAALLGFVLVSLGYVALRSMRASQGPPVAAATVAPATPEEAARSGDRVVAYYFHVTVRCTTCRAIEANSNAVIQERFAEDLSSGRLLWRLINVQRPENRHFIQDYQLVTRSLVLVRFEEGRPREHKVLHDTWELVGEPAAMQDYVAREVREFLRRLG